MEPASNTGTDFAEPGREDDAVDQYCASTAPLIIGALEEAVEAANVAAAVTRGCMRSRFLHCCVCCSNTLSAATCVGLNRPYAVTRPTARRIIVSHKVKFEPQTEFFSSSSIQVELISVDL